MIYLVFFKRKTIGDLANVLSAALAQPSPWGRTKLETHTVVEEGMRLALCVIIVLYLPYKWDRKTSNQECRKCLTSNNSAHKKNLLRYVQPSPIGHNHSIRQKIRYPKTFLNNLWITFFYPEFDIICTRSVLNWLEVYFYNWMVRMCNHLI